MVIINNIKKCYILVFFTFILFNSYCFSLNFINNFFKSTLNLFESGPKEIKNMKSLIKILEKNKSQLERSIKIIKVKNFLNISDKNSIESIKKAIKAIDGYIFNSKKNIEFIKDKGTGFIFKFFPKHNNIAKNGISNIKDLDYAVEFLSQKNKSFRKFKNTIGNSGTIKQVKNTIIEAAEKINQKSSLFIHYEKFKFYVGNWLKDYLPKNPLLRNITVAGALLFISYNLIKFISKKLQNRPNNQPLQNVFITNPINKKALKKKNNNSIESFFNLIGFGSLAVIIANNIFN